MFRISFVPAAMLAIAVNSGCQIDDPVGGIGGNISPNDPDVVYYHPGPEFRLAREAAAMEAAAEEPRLRDAANTQEIEDGAPRAN